MFHFQNTQLPPSSNVELSPESARSRVDGILKARGLGRSSENLLDIDQEPASPMNNDIDDGTPEVKEETVEEPTLVDSIEIRKPQEEEEEEKVEAEKQQQEVPCDDSTEPAQVETPENNNASVPQIENLEITDYTVRVNEQTTVEEGVQLIEIETRETVAATYDDADGNELSSSVVVKTEVVTNNESSLIDINDNNNGNAITTTTTTTVAWVEKTPQEDEIVAAEEKLAQLNLNSSFNEGSSNLIDVATEADNISSEITVTSSLAADVPSEESPTSNGHEV